MSRTNVVVKTIHSAGSLRMIEILMVAHAYYVKVFFYG